MCPVIGRPPGRVFDKFVKNSQSILDCQAKIIYLLVFLLEQNAFIVSSVSALHAKIIEQNPRILIFYFPTSLNSFK